MGSKSSAVAVLVAAAVLAGCAQTVSGNPVAAQNAGSPPPTVAASDLDGLLLDAAEINTAMGATEMTVSETSKRMWDSSGELSDQACVPVYGAAEYNAYTGSGWSAMRYVSMQEPGDDPPHFAEQAVVAFPNGDDAAKFVADAEAKWAGCADRRYTLKLPEYDVDTLWTVGKVSTSDGILSTSMVMEDGDGWGCRRAMTMGSNVVIDVTICGYNEADDTAETIAHDIAGKLPTG